MIDTDKYEGHTPAPWDDLFMHKVVAHEFDENDNVKIICDVIGWGDGCSDYEGEWGDNESEANQKLIADAPKLLTELKRLREAIDNIAKGMDEDWRHWRNELERLLV